ncbi:hypothetical protein ABIB40_000700 [Pedobacter sp. UYP30]
MAKIKIQELFRINLNKYSGRNYYKLQAQPDIEYY